MSLLSIDTLCDRCNNKTDTLVPRESAANWDTIYTCDVCGERGVRRVWSLPNLTKESYPDGYKRGGDYQVMKEAVKLQRKAASAKGAEKNDLMAAAAQVRQAATHEKKGKT